MIKSQNIEDHRAHWLGIAIQNNWDINEMFIIIYRNEQGEIVDTLSHLGLTEDIEMITTAYD